VIKAAVRVPKFYPSALRFKQLLFSFCRELRHESFVIFVEPSILTRRFGAHALNHFSGNTTGLLHAGHVLLRHFTLGGGERCVFNKRPKTISIPAFAQRIAAPALNLRPAVILIIS
jgi:hypothetical protein